MEKEIISRRNNIIIEVKKLKLKKYRDMAGLFIAEGYRNVRDSVLVSEKTVRIFYTAANTLDISFLENVDCEIYKVSEAVFSDLSDTASPQGILGVFPIPKFDKSLINNRLLLLNGVCDPGNLGTILRTALAAGFETIILDKNCADAYSGKVVRSAMSALLHLNILRCDSLLDSEELFKNFTLYAGALTEKSINLYDVALSEKQNMAFIIGSEANGIEDNILKRADILYKIPMSEKIESLNAAVAAAISMYRVFANKK